MTPPAYREPGLARLVLREVRRRWVAVLVVVWGLLLVTLSFGVLGDDATVAEHRDVRAARAAVDRAAVQVLRAAGLEVAVRISRYEFVADCKISLVRDGAMYHRRIELYTPPGTEANLVRTLVRRLPDEYGARTYGDGRQRRLSADATGFVRVAGRVAKGVVRLRLETGCRPLAPLATFRTKPTSAERDRIGEVLDLVGADRGGARWRTESVSCPAGGGSGGRTGGDEAEVRAVEQSVAEPPDRPLSAAADLAPPDATVLVREKTLLAYRQGAVSVVVTSVGGRLTLTTTMVTC